MTVFYQSYLNGFDSQKKKADTFTVLVANQSKTILTWFDASAYSAPHQREPSIKLFYKGKYISRIIEGCNALSVIILFISFVIAFKGRIKNTLFFIFFGSILIHIMNVLRIALLCMALYSFPKQEQLLHDVLFPLAIYGFVFMLWVIWVNKYSIYASKVITK